ncbi:MAG TPA: DNA primase [Candidatus Deferrimicrobium sp.]|nr:DNA primase [Candidatus Deferrimicrobium sp.]
MIAPETVEQVRLATDIVQLIGEYVRLKRAGRRFVALCPFHTEKTPSFSVTPDKQLYYCFGCGKGGTAFTFLMEHEKMSFVEAVRHLARRANIVIREDERDDVRREAIERLGYANEVAVDYFHGLLFRPQYREVLDSYLKGKRGITDDSISLFKLGLAGETWDGLLRHAAAKGLTGDDLARAGLAILSEGKGTYFDRFRQRLMIPVFNLSQKPIAFGARTLKKGETVKYMNSPETPLYVKGHVLFGLNFAKDFIRQSGYVCIVEGYFDFISLWQVGVKNVVASSGTAFTLPQARLLARFADQVYLFFDADSAGQQAALRSVDALFDSGLDVKVMVAPSGEDPDTLARKQGVDGIERLREEALGYISFRTRRLALDQSGIIEKEKLVKELAQLGNKIGDPTRRSLFYSEAADKLGVDVQLIQQVTFKGEATATTETRAASKHSAVEVGLLSLLFNNPGSIEALIERISPEDFESTELSRVYAAIVNQYRAVGEVDARKLVDSVRDPQFASLVTEIAAMEWSPEHVEKETKKLARQLLEQKQRRLRESLLGELAAAEAAKDHQKADDIIRQMKQHGLYADKTEH